ncbi:MAG: methyltransferase domain-containing protein [Myxococcales bacterium]|nr:methyltransferase domain-containing protein [Myxococcales bacterium]
MARWNPEQYARFARERRQPFDELLALVERRARMEVIDLGCGNGPLTIELAAALDARRVTGLDSSPAMLTSARDELARRRAEPVTATVRFELGEIEAYAPEAAVDLVFSNAALHWVDDHPALFERLRGWLRRGGQLAVQMPCNESHASHRVAAEVAAEAPFAEAMRGRARRSPVLAPEAYAELLARLGFGRQSVRLQIFGHELESSADVVEWVRGSLLTFYEAILGAERFAEFVTRYRTRLLGVIGDRRPYFYAYRRVLLWGIVG